MGSSLSFLLLSVVSFGIGYYIKARFEISQENAILTLQQKVEVQKREYEEKIQKATYQLSQMQKENELLLRELFNFKEEVKAQRFKEIAKEQNQLCPSLKALKNFL